MWRKFHLGSVFLAATLVLSACNLPKASNETPTAETYLTIAAETIQARFTLDALLTPQATLPVAASATPEPPTEAAPPTHTSSPTPVCDLAQFITDVSVPDGAVVEPGQTFTKTWRLKNIGACTWTSGYQLIFDNGDALNGPAAQALAGTVAPGQSVDLSVTLKAPTNAGSYRGYWKLRNSAGVLIPIAGGYQGNSFFVDIKVTPPTLTPSVTPPPPSPTIDISIILTLGPIIINSPTP